PYFPPESVFVLRGRTADTPLAAGVLVLDPTYADPHQLDAGMPCFRLGAFGTEGMQHKRVNGLFSFLAADDNNARQFGLDLMQYAIARLDDSDMQTLAA